MKLLIMIILCSGFIPVAAFEIHTIPGREPLELVKNGKSRAVIVIPNEGRKFRQMPGIANQKEYADFYSLGVNRIAANELQYWIERATGVKFPIICGNESAAKGSPALLVGFGDSEGIPPEGFRIETLKNGVRITPANLPVDPDYQHDGLYAVIYGVYDFLERFVGIRFYYPGEDGTVVPQKAALIIPPVIYTDSPVFSHRLMGGLYGPPRGTFDKIPNFTLHQLRWRNGAHGMKGTAPDYCHMPYDLTLVTGVRKAAGIKTTPPMPCYGDPATVSAFLRSVRNYYNKKPHPEWRAVPGKHIIPFSPPDHPIRCNCDFCKPLFDADAPFHAEASRIYGKFIADAALQLKREFPDKFFFLLPYYNYTECPEGLNLPDNTMVEVCLMYGHNLWHDKRIREISMKWLQDWVDAGGGNKIRIYTYPMWPVIESPVPILYYRNAATFTRSIQPLANGMYLDSLHDWHSEFPNMYCQMKLLWNPQFDVNAAIDEMCRLLYGKAAKPMKRLFSELNSFYESVNSINTPDIMKLAPYSPGRIKKGHLYDNLLNNRSVSLWMTLLQSARDSVLQKSVERRRIDFFAKAMDSFFIDYSTYKKGFVPGTMKVAFSEKLPEIDGKNKDPEWLKANVYEFVKAEASHETRPKYATRMRVLHDGRNLAFLFQMEEPQMEQLMLTRNVWDGDCLELLFEYRPGSIYQLVLNAAGKYKDAVRGKEMLRRKAYPRWKVGRFEKGWSIELLLPFAALDSETDYRKTPLRANFIRTRHPVGQDVQCSRWQTNFSKSNWELKSFGLLKLETESVKIQTRK